MPIKNKIKKELKSVQKEFETRVAGYIVTAMGLVAGLAWNDFVKSLIERYLPADNGGVWARLSYAILITILVVVVSVYLLRAIKRDQEEENKKDKK